MQQLSNEEYCNELGMHLTIYYKCIINQGISELINNGDLEMETGQLLRPVYLKTPIFYMIPRTHKPNNPGQPVVSSVNSHTEKLSA